MVVEKVEILYTFTVAWSIVPQKKNNLLLFVPLKGNFFHGLLPHFPLTSGDGDDVNMKWRRRAIIMRWVGVGTCYSVELG